MAVPWLGLLTPVIERQPIGVRVVCKQDRGRNRQRELFLAVTNPLITCWRPAAGARRGKADVNPVVGGLIGIFVGNASAEL